MAENPAPASSSNETVVWRGSTSQWVHWQFYLFCIIAAVAIIFCAVKWSGTIFIALLAPVVAVAGCYLVTRSTTYELTSERLLKNSGILNRRLDNLELYRVRDYTVIQPFFLRMLGLGNLHLVTSDAANPELDIHAISDIENVREQLRKVVEAARDRKRVRQMDVDAIDGGAPDLGDHHA